MGASCSEGPTTVRCLRQERADYFLLSPEPLANMLQRCRDVDTENNQGEKPTTKSVNHTTNQIAAKPRLRLFVGVLTPEPCPSPPLPPPIGRTGVKRKLQNVHTPKSDFFNRVLSHAAQSAHIHLAVCTRPAPCYQSKRVELTNTKQTTQNQNSICEKFRPYHSINKNDHPANHKPPIHMSASQLNHI